MHEKKGLYRLVHFGEYAMSIGEKGSTTEISRNEPDMWVSELQTRITDPTTATADRLKLLSELHSRFTFPCASLVFAILAVPLGLQNRRSGKSGGFTVSIAIILSYYVLMSVMRSVAEKGVVPPFVALWFPNMLFFAIGWYFLRLASLEKSLPLPSLKNVLGYFRRTS
jgi:lipopolysaccharide export system permease protein